MATCAHCLRVVATQTDYDTYAEGDGTHLCWSDFGSMCEGISPDAAYARGVADGMAQERADAVAFLLDETRPADSPLNDALAIECGDHVGAAKKGGR